MPSVCTFGGVEARTALTVIVFHVNTASGDTAASLCDLADATDNHTAATTAKLPTRMRSVLIRNVLTFIAPPRRTRSPRRRGSDRDRLAARPAQPPRSTPPRRRRNRSRLRVHG